MTPNDSFTFSFDTLAPPPVNGVASAAVPERPRRVKDSYEGAENSKNRGVKKIDSRPEHFILSKRKRATMNSAIVDAARNHALTRWAIRQDQNWIADCRFEACTGNPEVDRQMTEIVDGLLNPRNFDLSARHGIHSFSRLIQSGRTLHGDLLILKCRDLPGGRVKIFSYDRIDHPKPPSKQWQQGVELEPHTDRALSYAICRRDVENGRVGDLWRVVDANDAILHGYFEFDPEAIRGVSPLAPVVNTIVDLQESIDAAHAKVKLGQFLGLVVKRKAADSMAGRQVDENGNVIGEEVDPGTAVEENWDIDMFGGPYQMELDSDEDAKILESATPSEENMKLFAFSCRDSLKALDIPYCWWDGESQNFYGSIGETNLYRKACEHKRKSHFETMRETLRFFFQMAIIEGRMILPPHMTVDSLKFRLIPNGVAWFKPTEEVQASALAIALGLSSPQLECEKINANFETNIAQTKEAIVKMVDAGLSPKFAEGVSPVQLKDAVLKILESGAVPLLGKPPEKIITVNSEDYQKDSEGKRPRYRKRKRRCRSSKKAGSNS